MRGVFALLLHLRPSAKIQKLNYLVCDSTHDTKCVLLIANMFWQQASSHLLVRHPKKADSESDGVAISGYRLLCIFGFWPIPFSRSARRARLILWWRVNRGTSTLHRSRWLLRFAMCRTKYQVRNVILYGQMDNHSIEADEVRRLVGRPITCVAQLHAPVANG